MTIVIPQTAFDPAATVWARWAEQAIKSLQADSDLKTQNDANVNQGQSATLNALGRSIRDIESTITGLAETDANLALTDAYLSSLVTVSAAGGGGISTTVGTTTWPTGPSVSLTLDRTSQVLITITSSWVGNATVSASGAATTIGRVYGQVDGSTFRAGAGSAGSFNAFANQVSGGGQLQISEVRSMAAGAHTISAYSDGQIQGTSGSIQVGSINLTASVIG